MEGDRVPSKTARGRCTSVKKQRTAQQNRTMVQLILWVLMVAIMITLFMNFSRSNRERILRQNANYVMDSARQMADQVERALQEASDEVKLLSYWLGENLDSPEVTTENLKQLEERSSFDYVRFVDADGLNISSDGRSNDARDREYYLEGMAGNSGISVIMRSRITEETLMNFYTPVYYQGKIIGVLRGVFLAEERVKQLLKSSFFGVDATTFLCMSDGVVIAGNGPDLRYGYETGIRKLLFNDSNMDKEMVERVVCALENGQSTGFLYKNGRDEGNGYLTKLSVNDWYLIQTFPASVTSSFYQESNHAGIQLEVSLIVLFAVYIAFILISGGRQRRRLMAENRDMDFILRGMPMLFDRFILVDLDRNTYRYLRGSRPIFADMEPKGRYDELEKHIIQNVEGAADRERMRKFLSREQLRKLHPGDASIEHREIQEQIWVRLNAVCVVEQDGIPVKILLAKQNITEAKREELQRQEALQKAMYEAEKANRAKSAFLFNMSHDLRTPMNAIIGFTTLAQRHLTVPDVVQGYLEKIQNSSQILLGIINDVLDLARIESGKTTLHPKPGDLRDTMEALQEMFAESMEEGGIHFQMEFSVENPLVEYDPLRLSQIVINLLSNARKFTHAGGNVQCLLQQKGVEDGKACFCLTIADTGIGISPEFLPHIFGAFERERTSTVAGIQGTGLGLSIVKELVDMMGGTVAVESEQGVGTRFTVELSFPVVGEEALPIAQLAEEAHADTKGKRLLLVEDNELNREIALEILQEAGYLVEVATDGDVAVETVSHSQPGYFDLILMDIQMPRMDGYQATRLIRALPNPALANIPIAAMTANAFDEDKQRAAEAGMNAHIAKPLDLKQLMDTITSLLTKKNQGTSK